MTLPEEVTLIFPRDTDFPDASTNDAVPVEDALNPVTVTRVGTSTGI